VPRARLSVLAWVQPPSGARRKRPLHGRLASLPLPIHDSIYRVLAFPTRSLCIEVAQNKPRCPEVQLGHWQCLDFAFVSVPITSGAYIYVQAGTWELLFASYLRELSVTCRGSGALVDLFRIWGSEY
jgi:hypothetical protein